MHTQHVEVPRLGGELELQLLDHITATQRRILNPLSKARDRTCNLMVPSTICFCCTTMGTPQLSLYKVATVMSPTFQIRKLNKVKLFAAVPEGHL